MSSLHIFVQLLCAISLLAQQTNAIPRPNSERVIRIPTDEKLSETQVEIMRLAKTFSMRNLMSEDVDPCDDFYTFSCGKWKRFYPAITIEHLTTGMFESMSDRLDYKIANLLTKETDFNYTETDNKVKNFYLSCVNIKNLKATYKQNLMDIIDEFGEMPALVGDKWNNEKFDWMATIANIAHKYGKDIIISVDIMPDFRDNSMNRVYIGQADLPLEARSMYLDAETEIYRTSYVAKIKRDLIEFLKIKPPLALQTAKEIVDFEVSLAHGLVDDTLGLGLEELSELITIANMQEKYKPTIDMKKLVNISLGEVITDPVYEYAESYQINLKKIIPETPKRIIANYIFYTLLSDFMLDTEKKREAQAKSCIDKTKSYFAKNVDNMVYRRYSTNKTERDVQFMWSELKETFKATLLSDRLQWISPSTRQYALEKLNSLKMDINSYKDHNFTEEFDELVTNDNNYIENLKSVLELATRQAITELHKPPKPIEAGQILSYTPANILIENTIKMPVSLLQPYFLWAGSYPNAVKFGTLGALVGHELIHAFDDTGRKFDKDGNSRDWWDEQSTNTFIERTKCFSHQYSRYSYGGRLLPMSVSQSENIADNGGVRLAYEAYLRWYEDALRSGQDMQLEILPKFNYSSKQVFFISFAQVWCNDAHPGVKNLQTSTDQHVPGEFRVIGSLSNFKEFAKEFKCANGTKMNPGKKCEIY